MDSPFTHLSTNSGEESDGKPKAKGRGRSKKKFTKKKSTPRVLDGHVEKVGTKFIMIDGFFKCRNYQRYFINLEKKQKRVLKVLEVSLLKVQVGKGIVQ